jgi:hypothetical protein
MFQIFQIISIIRKKLKFPPHTHFALNLFIVSWWWAKCWWWWW